MMQLIGGACSILKEREARRTRIAAARAQPSLTNNAPISQISLSIYCSVDSDSPDFVFYYFYIIIVTYSLSLSNHSPAKQVGIKSLFGANFGVFKIMFVDCYRFSSTNLITVSNVDPLKSILDNVMYFT